jgi:hypothetical protein
MKKLQKIANIIQNSWAFMSDEDLDTKFIKAMESDNVDDFVSLITLKSRRRFLDSYEDDITGISAIAKEWEFLLLRNNPPTQNKDPIDEHNHAHNLKVDDFHALSYNIDITTFCFRTGSTAILDKMSEMGLIKPNQQIELNDYDELYGKRHLELSLAIFCDSNSKSFLCKKNLKNALTEENENSNLQDPETSTHYSYRSRWLAGLIIGHGNRSGSSQYSLRAIPESAIYNLIDYQWITAEDVLGAARYIEMSNQILPSLKKSENPLTKAVLDRCQDIADGHKLLAISNLSPAADRTSKKSI